MCGGLWPPDEPLEDELLLEDELDELLLDELEELDEPPVELVETMMLPPPPPMKPPLKNPPPKLPPLLPPIMTGTAPPPLIGIGAGGSGMGGAG